MSTNTCPHLFVPPLLFFAFHLLMFPVFSTIFLMPPKKPKQVMHTEGAHRALSARCAKSWLFATTGSHGSQGPEFCTLQPLSVHQGCFFSSLMLARGPRVLNSVPHAVLNWYVCFCRWVVFRGVPGMNNIIIGAVRTLSPCCAHAVRKRLLYACQCGTAPGNVTDAFWLWAVCESGHLGRIPNCSEVPEPPPPVHAPQEPPSTPYAPPTPTTTNSPSPPWTPQSSSTRLGVYIRTGCPHTYYCCIKPVTVITSYAYDKIFHAKRYTGLAIQLQTAPLFWISTLKT